MGKPRATTRVPPKTLTKAFDCLDMGEGITSVWRRLLKGHGIALRTFQEYAAQHRRKRKSEALQDQLAICGRLAPRLLRACEKCHALDQWQRFRRLRKYRHLSNRALDKVVSRAVKQNWPGLRCTARSLGEWRRQYRKARSTDKLAAGVAALLGLTLTGGREAK